MMQKRTYCNSGKSRGCFEKRNISRKKRIPCRMIKMLVFVLCLSGFGYQMAEFLANYYKYPTVLNTGVVVMKEFPTPAFTYCSRYLIDYDKYCRMYSTRCFGPRDVESFCRDNPLKCDGNKTDVITEISFKKNSVANLLEIVFNTTNFTPLFQDERKFQGPFIYYNDMHLGVDACYTLGTGFAATGLRTITIAGTKKKVFGSISTTFRKRESIFFIDEEPYGTLFIHSPLHSFKSSTKSLTMKGSYHYEVYISLEEEMLLPSPYETHCEDYQALWKENKTAPLSRDMCQHVCQSESNYFETGYRNYDLCDDVGDEILEDNQKCRCYRGCKDECLKLKYHFTSSNSYNEKYKIADKSQVIFNIESNEKRVTYHRPQYMAVELFSYVGGLLGCWLGISIWTCTGIFWTGLPVLAAKVKYYRNILRRRRLVQNAN